MQLSKSLKLIIISLIMFSFLNKTPQDMEGVWKSFKNWMSKNAPQLLDNLNAPASDQDIANLEKLIGAKLPEPYADFLKIHNGQKYDSQWLLDGEEILSTERIIEEWTIWKELLDAGDFDGIQSYPDKGIKSDWWNAKWIPITHDGGGNHICLDLDPAPGGNYGQIIRMEHDMEERTKLGSSFEKWFGNYVDGVTKGKYVYSEEYEAIINKEDVID